jgi:hypothetical protein
VVEKINLNDVKPEIPEPAEEDPHFGTQFDDSFEISMPDDNQEIGAINF